MPAFDQHPLWKPEVQQVQSFKALIYRQEWFKFYFLDSTTVHTSAKSLTSLELFISFMKFVKNMFKGLM